MGFCSVVGSWILVRSGFVLTLALAAGCQMPQPGLGTRFVAHSAMVNASGLTTATRYSNLNVQAGIPHGWEPMTTQSTPIYTHQQWRSGTHSTGVGVAYIHMPLPMSAKALVWFARNKYSQQNAKENMPDPQVMGEWTDSLGREWFEGESDKYHVKGYVLTSGFDAWVVYAGYRVKVAPQPAEISLAFRSVDSIVPLPLEKQNSVIGSNAGGSW